MSGQDWSGRARREAAAIIAEAYPNTTHDDYDSLVSVVAIGWLQGAIYGNHSALTLMDESFDHLRAAL